MIIIGHRGARGLAQENTISAIKLGQKLTDAVEFDVRVTSDRVPVLNHNTGLFDANGKHWLIKNSTYTQLKKIRPELATLEEALSLRWGVKKLFIEIKPFEPTEPIIKIIKKHLKHRALDVSIGSFDIGVLRSVRTQMPDAKLWVNERWSSLRAQRRARQLNANMISIYQRVLWFGLIRRLCRRGTAVYTYTLDNPEKAQKWRKHGLSGVFTDFPNLYKHKITR